MKILHTADWHLNDRLGRQDRQPDLLRALGQIRQFLDDYQVDVMVVAGDLFSERSSREQWRDAIGQLKELFLPYLERGGTIVAISGNHDNDSYFEMLRDALDMAATRRSQRDGVHSPGRLYIQSVARVLRLADAHEEVVQFVLMPYPKDSLYLRGEGLRYSSLAEKHRYLQGKFKQVLDEMQRSKIDPTLPAVLVSHIHVRGVTAHNLYRLSESEDILFEPGDIPDFAYVAYGHIHRPGPVVAGADHIRYSGSIERMDANERGEQKSVVLFEIKGKRCVKIDCLPLVSTPLYQVVITDPDAQLPSLAAQYPDASQALVDYTLHWEPGRHSRDSIADEVEAIFPRWYNRGFHEIGTQLISAHGYTAGQLRDVKGNVRRYLDERLAKDPYRDELLALAEGLLTGGGWR